MSLYRSLIRPLLFRGVDPETAHDLVMSGLRRLGHSSLASAVERGMRINHPGLRQQLMGITFPNPVGLAAGFDKFGTAAVGLQLLGFGFLELGSITFKPQSGHSRPRIHRLVKDQALVNRMGFNNPGAVAFSRTLSQLRGQLKIPVGISLGKGASVPPDVESVIVEYSAILDVVYESGDYFTVNVSSPNTAGLRGLQGKSELMAIITSLTAKLQALADQHRTVPRPLLIKLSPDLTAEEFDNVLEVCANSQPPVHLIMVNTTLRREVLSQPDQVAHLAGGISGRPLYRRACELVAKARRQLPGDRVIVGVGGIMTAGDGVKMLIDSGADLVQLYTGLVYTGPDLIRSINLELVSRLRRDGVDHIVQLRR